MDIISYSLSKKIAASAVSGVSSMSVDGTTLNIDTNDGQRLQMVFPQPKDGVSVTDIDVNANNQIVFTMSDGTEFISGEIPTVKGDKGDPFKYSDFTQEQLDSLKGSDGFSPSAKIEKVGDTATITITDKDGTTTATIKDGTGGTGSGEENVIESIKVNGVVQTVADDKSVDITVPTVDVNKNYVDTELAKKANTSDIPSLDGYAKTSEIPSKVSQLENDSNYLSSIPEEYVTETELSAKGYLTEHQDISGKVDKVEGKSLISDAEITRLATVDNYDDTDIRTELANKADATSIPSKVSVLENDSKYQTESDVTTTLSDYATKTYVGEQIASAEHLKREIVTVLPSDEEASDNIIYMLKVESTTGNDKYREYMKIDGTVQMVGDTSVDLTDYAKTVEIPTTVSELTDSVDYAKKTDIPTTLPANGGNSDTVNNHTVETDVPTDAVFTDTTYSDATQIEHGLMSVDDKKKLDGLTKYTPDGTTITADEDGTLHGVKVTVDDALSSESTNPVQNKVVKAYVDKKASENVDFSTSTSKILNGTIESPMLVTNATKNLLNPTLETTEQNGVTCTRNVDANGKPDGTYTLNGTATADFLEYSDKFPIPTELKNKTLIFYDGLPDGLRGYACVRFFDAKGEFVGELNKSVHEMKISKATHYDLLIFSRAGVVNDNLLLKPILTTDLSATYDDFVPYSGYDIKTCGKNLLDLKNKGKDTYTNAGMTYTKQSDGSYKRSGTPTQYPANVWLFGDYMISPNGTNHLLTLKKGHTYFVADCVLFSIVDGDAWSHYNKNKVTPEKDIYVTGIRESDVSENVTYDDIVYPRVFEADHDLGWEPYTESTVHIDSTTKFPLLGLKSFDGITNIISPCNVEVTYAKSDSGKAILDMSENKLDKDNVVNNQTTTEAGFALDARQANPNIDGSLAKQISDLNGSLKSKILNEFIVSPYGAFDLGLGTDCIVEAIMIPGNEFFATPFNVDSHWYGIVYQNVPKYPIVTGVTIPEGTKVYYHSIN